MLDALKTLFENNIVSEEIRAEIEEAWNEKIKENRQQVTAELREEFATKYEHDKQTMVEAIDTLISEKLSEEITEFQEDRVQLAEAKAKYAIAMRENADLLKEFVVDQLGKEISELHEDQKAMSENFSKLEEFVVEALAKEIAEFYEDKQDLAETKVRLVREAKNKFVDLKKQFIEKSTTVVSETIDANLTKEIAQLKEDIDTARQNDFGRRLFEAFASEYNNSYLNEKGETAKLMKVVDLKDQKINETTAKLEEAKKELEEKQKEVARITESAERERIMHDLTAPLSKEQKAIMTDLLESVQTAKLSTQFDKYLPAVIDGKTPAKKAKLTEGTSVTGNREEVKQNNNSEADEHNVIEIRRLAGLN